MSGGGVGVACGTEGGGEPGGPAEGRGDDDRADSDAGSRDAAPTSGDAAPAPDDAAEERAPTPDGGPDAGPTALGVSCGGHFTCALLGDATTKCWGNSAEGRLGLGDGADRGDGPGEMGASLPTVDLGAGRAVRALATGSNHACAILDDASLRCWGRNLSGQLGRGDRVARGGAPGQMGANLPAIDLGAGRSARGVAVGGSHTCAILDDGAVKCWGSNQAGQLGVGDTRDRGDDPGEMGASLPAVNLGPGRTARGLAAGRLHTCALLDDASVRCWGGNAVGQLGLGDTTSRGDRPGTLGAALPRVELGPGRTVAAVSAFALADATCAVLDDGRVKCWGDNAAGQLGVGDARPRGGAPGEMGAALPAVDFGPGRTARSVATGHLHGCALLDDATLKCWGANAAGQLGLGDRRSRGAAAGDLGANLAAVALGPGRTARQVSAGIDHVCAVLDDTSVRCWGDNASGKLGLGDTVRRGDDPGEMGASLPAVLLR